MPTDDEAGACDATTWEPVLFFDRDSMDFVLGFEAGMIYTEATALLELGMASPFTRMIHAENAEMAIRIAEAKGLAFSAKPTEDDDWLEFTMEVIESAD